MKRIERVIVPGSGAELLRRELALAFAAQGLRVSEAVPEVPRGPAGPNALSALVEGPGTLLFSVNFQGLSPLRETLEFLEKSGGTAAVWCVDNPWNILSGVRDPRWKRLPFFVTDASFVEPLRAHGTERVRHLPLASCPELFAPNPVRDAAFPPPSDLAPFVFVGRSAFPNKEAFFAGQELPETPRAEALALLEKGLRPDLLWWERRLGLENAPFWPGKKGRLPAFGAEESNLAWRAGCLGAIAGGDANRASGSPALDIIGDQGWLAHLPRGARLRAPVDYYARLPGIYGAARYSLCLTSLQLPHGLTQRHFDVWTAGGLALCDAGPGLGLFPEELTRPVSFRRAADIPALAEGLEKISRRSLIADWQACLREGHTYAHRVRHVLEEIEKSG